LECRAKIRLRGISLDSDTFLHKKLFAVFCVFEFKTVQPPQHVITHMRNNNPFAIQGRVTLQQGSIIQMIFHYSNSSTLQNCFGLILETLSGARSTTISQYQDSFLYMGQADVVFRQTARCGFGTADVSQLRTLKPAPESVVVGIAVQH